MISESKPWLVGIYQRLSTTQLMDVIKDPIFKDPYEPFARISGFNLWVCEVILASFIAVMTFIPWVLASRFRKPPIRYLDQQVTCRRMWQKNDASWWENQKSMVNSPWFGSWELKSPWDFSFKKTCYLWWDSVSSLVFGIFEGNKGEKQTKTHCLSWTVY